MLSIKINIKKSTNSDNMNMAGGRKLQIFSQQFRNLANVTLNNVHNTLIFNFVHFVWRQVRKYAKSYIKKRFPFTSEISNYVAWQKKRLCIFIIYLYFCFKIYNPIAWNSKYAILINNSIWKNAYTFKMLSCLKR